jgi:hypothetical protein
MRLGPIVLLLVAIAGCKRVTSTGPDEHDALTLPHNIDGTWTLERVVGSGIPQPPRTAACPSFATNYEPSSLTIANDTLYTNGGRPPGNVTMFGVHDLAFDESELWNSVEGVIEYVHVYYEIDQRSTIELRGTATAIGDWPDGSCAHTFTITCVLQ